MGNEVISTYLGTVLSESKMKDYLDISRFANTSDKGKESPKSQFTILPQFATHLNGFENGCDGVIPGCSSLSTIEMEVTDEIWVAQLLDGCSVLDLDFIMSDVGLELARRLRNTIVKRRAQFYFNKLLTPILGTHKVEFKNGVLSTAGSIILSLENQGFDRDQITLVISSELEMETIVKTGFNEMDKGTLNITANLPKRSPVEETLRRMFGINDVVVVPKDVLTGKYDETISGGVVDEDIAMVGLIKDYSLFKVYCDTEPEIDMVKTNGQGGFLRKPTPYLSVFGKLGQKTVLPNTVFFSSHASYTINPSEGTPVAPAKSDSTTTSAFNKKNSHTKSVEATETQSEKKQK